MNTGQCEDLTPLLRLTLTLRAQNLYISFEVRAQSTDVLGTSSTPDQLISAYLFNDPRPIMEPFVRTFTRSKEDSGDTSPGLSSPTPIIIAPLSPEGPPRFHHVCPTDQFITYERVQPMVPCQAPLVTDGRPSLRQLLQLQHDKFVQDVETHLLRCPSDHWPRHLLHCYYREVQGLEALRYAAVAQNYHNISFHPIIHQFYDKERNVLLGQASHSFTSYRATRFVDSSPQQMTSCFLTPGQVDSLGLPAVTAPQQMTSCTPDQGDTLPAGTTPQQMTSCTPDQLDSPVLPAATTPQQMTSCFLTPDQVDSLGLPTGSVVRQTMSSFPTPDHLTSLETVRGDPDPAKSEKSLSRRPRHPRTTEAWSKKHRALPYFKPDEADLPTEATSSIHKVQGMSRRRVADRKAPSTSLSHRDCETSSKVRRRNKLRSLMPTSHRWPAVPHTDHSLKQEFPPVCSTEELTIFLTTESRTS